MIIESSDNRFYSVWPTGNSDLDHVWLGLEVNFNVKKNRWVRRYKRFPQLVRKAAARVVSETQGHADA